MADAAMADAAVEVILNNLKQLQLYNAYLFVDVKKQIESVETDLGIISAFLKDTVLKKRREDDRTKVLVQYIRDAVYEVEDEIDAFVTLAMEKRLSILGRLRKPTSFNLRTISEKVDAVREKVQGYQNILHHFSSSNVRERKPHKQPPPIREDSRVVGFVGEIESVISHLTEETEKLDIITIVGMPGKGKTTLAWTTFHREKVMYEFPIRIWINVSHDFTEKDVFLDILKHFTSLTDDIIGKDDEELARLVATYLEKEKFLIVADDVWSAYDWDRLRIALPESNNKGKVLITSCNENVGRHANKSRPPFELGFLTQSESWSLLQLEVFDDLYGCPLELESIGKLIANQCEGLPQAILVMARTLVEEDLSSSNMSERRIAWTKVCSQVPQYHNDIFYRSLPHYLRPCFLYFGMFPYGKEIPVWRLIRLWIAEGFIHHDPSMSLEETAETYLRDLINRNLVAISRMKSNGNIKTCCIHRMLHEFCKIKAGNEGQNFFLQIKFSDGVFDSLISDLSVYRRLCISSNILEFLSLKPVGPHVRSFLDFSFDEVCLPAEKCPAIPAGFKLLKVLDVIPIIFTKISSEMYELVHLRFLALSINLAILSAKFSKLWNLQTLIIHTTSRTLEIRADIWQLTQLRHLVTNASATLAKTGKHSEQRGNLQTLAMISVESCTEELFDRACNLKKLGIRGRLSLLFGEVGSFDCFGKQSDLETLKLVNDVFPRPPSLGQVHRLPPAYKFPPRLRSLTLAGTYLSWSEMRVLSLLEKLEVLKLKDLAFIGPNWVTEGGGFDSLKALHIGRTDLAIWVAFPLNFPRLTTLKLSGCEELREVPLDLADLPSFQRLELLNSKLAAASAVRIQDEIKRHREFKLSIFPPIE